MTETAIVTVLHASQLSRYADCPRRAATRMFRRDVQAAGFQLRRGRRGIAAVQGTAAHFGAEVGYREKAKHGTLPPVSVPLDAARDQLTEAFRQGEIEFDTPRGGVTLTQGDAEKQLRAMVMSYHRTIAPEVEPLLIEERLEAEIKPGLILSGKPDIVCREPKAIRDHKTGTRPPGSFVPQLGAYSLLARSIGVDIERANIDFVQRVRPDKPQPDPVSIGAHIAHAETAASNIIRHIADDLRTFREGDPARRIRPGDPWAFLANPSSNLCSPRWCPAYGTEFCHEGKVTHG